MFIKEKFENMMAAKAVDQAAKYLKENRKWTVKGKLSPMAERVERRRETNKAKMRSRNKFYFSGTCLTSKDLCKECGKPSPHKDHLIPHTKFSRIPARAIERICLKLQVNPVSKADFIKSWDLNGQALCDDCNDAKKDRENSVTWTNVGQVVQFYFREKNNKFKGMRDRDIKAEVLAKHHRSIVRFQLRINAAKRQGKLTQQLYEGLARKEKEINKQIKAAGGKVFVTLSA